MIRHGALALAAALVLAAPAAAKFELTDKPLYYDLAGSAAQGGLLIGRAPPGSRVMVGGRDVPVAADGSFLVGFGRLHPTRADIQVAMPDRTIEARNIPVLPRVYPIQRIDGLPERMVEPPPYDMARIEEEQRLIRAARARLTETPYFRAGFVWPTLGPITGVYGSQRILNGRPRAPHFGVDIAAGKGATVVAMSRGIVALAREDLFFNGNVVMLDHGLGLTSVYSHLDSIAVTEGDLVNVNQMIGAVGATGRVTGPHLHWGVHLREDGLDPQLLVGPMPQR